MVKTFQKGNAIMIFPAKVDAWGAVLSGALGLVVLVVGIVLNGYVVALGVLFFLLIWRAFLIKYEITSSEFVIRPLGMRMPLEAITEVFPTRAFYNSLTAASAPSLEKLRVNYRKKNGKMGFTLISPKDKSGFLRELARAAPGLQVSGDRVVREVLQ